MTLHPDWLRPEWQTDGVGALMTTRSGGVSLAPFDSFNLRAVVGDDPHAVAQNQRLLAEAIGATPVYLNQVHGANVVRLGAADLEADAPIHDADGSVTTEPGRAVGAAHAGWRGLAAGVLEATLAQVCDAARCAPGEVQTWLGACIGPAQFEVGPDVLEAFGASQQANASPRFVAKGAVKWYADLPALARDRLLAAGVYTIDGGRWCTVSEPSRFFSFRRNRVTGRMAAVIWIDRRG